MAIKLYLTGDNLIFVNFNLIFKNICMAKPAAALY